MPAGEASLNVLFPADDLEHLSETKRRILRAASEAFDRYSVRRTSMEDVARIAGISRQTIYRNFQSKEELVAAVSELKSRAITQAVRRNTARLRDPRRKIEVAILTCVEQLVGDRQTRELLECSYEELIIRSKRPEVVAEITARWQPILTEAAKAGVLRPALDMAEVISWLTDIELLAAMRVLVTGQTVSAVWRQLDSLVMEGLCRR